MTSSFIDVSVVIAAWNAAETIERAAASALASKGVNVELVIVDDASADATMDVARAIVSCDRRVAAERLAVNSGPSVARNRAIELARGRYVAVLDADDAIEPERLSSLVAIADQAGADIVVDNMVVVDEAAPETRELFLADASFAVRRGITLAEWIRFNQPLKRCGGLGYLKPLIARENLGPSGALYDADLRNSEDYHLVAHLLAGGARMIYTPKPGYIYRRSAGSTSHRLKPFHTRALIEAEDRFAVRFASRLTTEELELLAERKRRLRRLHQLVSSVEAVKRKDAARLAGLLASDLDASAYTLSALARIAMGKALRRKLV